MKKLIVGLMVLGSISAMASEKNCKTIELGTSSRTNLTDYATYCADVNSNEGKVELENVTVQVTNDIREYGIHALKANKRNAKFICKKLLKAKLVDFTKVDDKLGVDLDGTVTAPPSDLSHTNQSSSFDILNCAL